MALVPQLRESARVVLFDEQGRLVLIRRTRPDAAPYLTAAGGGIEAGESERTAARRELREELGAQVVLGPVILHTEGDERVPVSQWFHLGRLLALDPAARSGPELREHERGSYETVRLPLTDPELATLRPRELLTVLRTRGPALAEEAAALSAAP